MEFDVYPEREVNGVRRRLTDISRAKKLLDLEPNISFEGGLRILVEWRRKRHDIPGEETKFHEDGRNLQESGKTIPLLLTQMTLESCGIQVISMKLHAVIRYSKSWPVNCCKVRGVYDGIVVRPARSPIFWEDNSSFGGR
jgi:hypothetical protein